MKVLANEFDKRLGAQLRITRQARGLSQTQIAEALSISFQQVQKYERGTNKINFEKIIQLSQLFKVPVNYWMKPALAGLKPTAGALLHERSALSLLYSYHQIKNPRTRGLLTSLARELASC